MYSFVAGAGLDLDPLSVEAAHLMQNAAKQNMSQMVTRSVTNFF
jgi:hypothetical protein